jgi:septal ring factor EnvC (AmiA/AmiB activator)
MRNAEHEGLPNELCLRIVFVVMNSKIVAILLVLICLALGGGLYLRDASAKKEKMADTETINELTNTLAKTTANLDMQKLVNETLERDLDNRIQEVKVYSNNLATVSSNLDKAQLEAKVAAEASKAEVLRRDAKIAELEAERDGLNKKMTDLTGNIADLQGKISDTQRRLDSSEGDRDFLLKELKRLQTEKAELERQFNDLVLVREQVRKLKDELSLAKRLDMIRRGIWGNIMKGGERLQKGYAAPAGAKTNYNLNVELNRDGSMKITPPPNSSGATNAPPGK